MAEAFGFDGKKQLEQVKWYVLVAGSKKVGKGLRDGADPLDKKETLQHRSMVGTALYGGAGQTSSAVRHERSSEVLSGPARAAGCMLKKVVQVPQRGACAQLDVSPRHEMPNEIRAVTDTNWAGDLEALRSTSSGWIYLRGIHSRRKFVYAAECGALASGYFFEARGRPGLPISG